MSTSSSNQVAYCLYENWTDSGRGPGTRFTLHRRDCVHCNQDRVKHNDKGPHDAWHALGEFARPFEAMRQARDIFSERGTTTFHFCGHCLPGEEA